MLNIKAKNVERVGHMFDYELEDGTLLHDSEWNGEKYITGRGQTETEYRPVYRFEAEKTDINALVENSEEWDRAVEIIGFKQST